MGYVLNDSLPMIGKGLSLNPMYNKLTGGLNHCEGTDLINQSIEFILSTPEGTRFMVPEFGSKLHLLVFESNDFILTDLLKLYTKEALDRWEKRIVVLNIEVQDYLHSSADVHRNTVGVSITYRLANSNIMGNYVYPFNRETYELGSGGDQYNVY